VDEPVKYQVRVVVGFPALSPGSHRARVCAETPQGTRSGTIPQASGSGVTGSSTASDQLEELGDLVVDLTALLHESRDLLDGMNHSRVVPATELSGNGGIAEGNP